MNDIKIIIPTRAKKRCHVNGQTIIKSTRTRRYCAAKYSRCTYSSRMLIFCGSCFFLFRTSRSFFLLVHMHKVTIMAKQLNKNWCET